MNKLLESFHKKILNSNAIEKITEEEMEEFLELKDKAIPKKVITSIPNLEYENKIIEKIKNTLTQSSLNKKQREENVKNVYKIINKEKIKAKSIILFDDIYTTGATANECAKVLVQKGINRKQIGVLTIAKD